MSFELFVVLLVSSVIGSIIGAYFCMRSVTKEAEKRLDAELQKLDRQLEAYRK